MRFLLTLAAAGSVALAAAGCGSDDSGTDAGTAATPATTAAATPSTASADPGALSVKMTEFAFTPQDVTAKAGKVTITAPNDGKVAHELVVLKTDADPGKLPMKDGEVDESTSVGEIPDVPAGGSKSVTLQLKPGRYAMVCNLPGHYK